MPNPYGVTIFCDDVREEVSGKQTLVGVYGPELHYTGGFPAKLPVLWSFVRLSVPGSEEYASFDYVIKKEVDEKEISLVGFTHPIDIKKLDDPNKVTTIGLSIPIPDLQLEKDCRILSRAYFDGEEVKLGSLNVILHEQKETEDSAP